MSELEPRRVPVEYVEQPCRSALNRVKGMGFKWSLNPYTGCEHRCIFCYVRAFEKRADREYGEGYGRRVRVKTNLEEVLRAELARPSWKREHVVIGAATDPYQPAEGRYKLTRKALIALSDALTPAGLITRGPMVVRDIDVLTTFAHRAEISITFSLPTLDYEVWRRTEPGTAPPEQRLRALRRLNAAGIRCGVSIAPVLPGLSDCPEQLEAVVKAASEAGASHLWAGLLYLKEGTREHFLESLARYWPQLLSSYQQEYRGRAYLPNSRGQPMKELVGGFKRAYRLGYHANSLIQPTIQPQPVQLSLLE